VRLVLCALLFSGFASAGQTWSTLKTAVLDLVRQKVGPDLALDDAIGAAAAAAAEKLFGSLPGAGQDEEQIHENILEALEEAGVTDRNYYPVTIVAGSPGDLLESLSAFLQSKGAPSLEGMSIGLEALSGSQGAVCVLLCVDRVIELKNVPTRVAKPAKVLLKGRILKKAGGLQVVVQTPDLKFLRPTIKIKASDFIVALPFGGGPGRYRVEVLGDLGYGPVVLNLFDALVGPPGEAGQAPPEKVIAAEAAKKGTSKNKAWALFHSINALRDRQGLPPLQVDASLSLAALNHGRDMKKNGFFGHTSPNEGTLESRLKKLGIESPGAAEVMTISHTPQGALLNLAASPSHLCRLLDKAFNRMGIAAVKTPERFIFVAVLALL
jgi:uncharacterized protein YkwD